MLHALLRLVEHTTGYPRGAVSPLPLVAFLSLQRGQSLSSDYDTFLKQAWEQGSIDLQSVGLCFASSYIANPRSKQRACSSGTRDRGKQLQWIGLIWWSRIINPSPKKNPTNFYIRLPRRIPSWTTLVPCVLWWPDCLNCRVQSTLSHGFRLQAITLEARDCSWNQLIDSSNKRAS